MSCLKSSSAKAAPYYFPILALAVSSVTNVQSVFVPAGDAQVSAQQLFLGNEQMVYILDKVENNPGRVGNPEHPAWAAEWSLNSQKSRFMDVVTNTFCAGGIALGNGDWLSVGGNQPYGATLMKALDSEYPRGLAVRLLKPCTDGNCQWVDDPANYMTTRRWYPSLETLADGSAFIIGGEEWGSFVNEPYYQQNNPTYEIFPGKRTPVTLQFLQDTMPANLYPLTWLLPSGRIFLQANWGTEILQLPNTEIRLPDVPHAVRTYPGSAATAMLPLTPANKYTATVLFCGGGNYASDEWEHPVTYYTARAASKSCVQMSPDVSHQWVENDDMPQGRSMGQFIILPDQRLFLTNGVANGVAGYNDAAAIYGEPYGDNPVYSGAYFNAAAPAGKRWTTKGVGNLNYPRMYHSSATLLPDGSVFISGSNPYSEFVPRGATSKKWWSETRNEIFRPDYFSKPRPTLRGLPTSLGYGGPYFDLMISAADMQQVTAASQVKAVVIKTGFSTHGMNFVELRTTLTKNQDGSAILHVSQLPRPTVFQPGPSLFFLVINGVPSHGKMIMAGNGQISAQTILQATTLPKSSAGL